MATKKQETKNEEQETNLPAVPDYMKKFMAATNQDTESMTTASMSVPRLSYRGKRWRWVRDGEETMDKRLEIDVIIVGVEPDAGRYVKTYYEKSYTPGDTTPPDCSSSDGLIPDVWVSNPQSPRCAGCPKNIFGSAVARDGKGKAKACHDSKRLWLVQPGDPEKIVYGLGISVMSLKNMSEYGKYIAKNNLPLALAITQLSLDDEAEFPKVCFKHVGFVEESEAQAVIELNTERPWKSKIQREALPMERPQAALPGPDALPWNNSAPANPVTNPVRKEGGVGIADIVGNWSK